MKKSLIAVALIGAFAAPAAVQTAMAAEEAAPASPHTLTANVGLVSDYRFRGISQTFGLPAIQGGIDYSHASGLYVGTWASNVYGGNNFSGLGVNYYNGGMEWDFYGGFKFTPVEDLTFDIGGLYYYYPGAAYATNATTSAKYDNFELYAGVSYKWLSFKYNYALTNYFGVKGTTIGANAWGGPNCGTYSHTPTTGTFSNNCAVSTGGSGGSSYADLTAAIPVMDKLTLNAHVGYANVSNYGLLNYYDWKLGASYDLNGWILGANYIGTSAKSDVYRTIKMTGSPNGKSYDTSSDTVVLSISRTF